MADHADTLFLERLVKIPGFVDLSDAQQAAVCVRLNEIEQPKNAHSLDADALCARLNSISSLRIPDKSFSELSSSTTSTTPPPDYEAIAEEYRSLEQEARENLEADGCPPCLPDDPSFLVRDAPVQYKGIISYWKAFPANYGGVLCAQWKDRKAFRNYQERNCKHYLQVKTLDRLKDRTHERRRKHRLEGAVHLHPDPRQQGQDDTWKEFQDFHLQKLEELEKELQIERENLSATRTKLETGDISEFGTILSSPEDIAASRVQSYEVRSASADRLRKLHQEILLPWIEEQRTMVTTAQAASSGGAGAHNHQLDITCRKSIPCRKKKTAKERSVLIPNRSGISKSVPQKRVLRRQEKPREVQKGLANSAASNYSTTQMPDVRRDKARSSNPSPLLRPFRPQKVTKVVARQSASKQPASSTKQRNTTNRTRLKFPRFAQHQQPAKVTSTKSGRKSRRPERPGYISYP